MLSSFKFILDSKKFPFDSVVALISGFRYKTIKFTPLAPEQRVLVPSHLSDEQKSDFGPVFSIDDKLYVAKNFGRVGDSYPGMKESFLDVFNSLSSAPIKRTTMPIMTEVLNGYVYGLIEWIPNANDFFSIPISAFDFKQMIEAGLELSNHNVFHLDLNFGNIIKSSGSGMVYFIDPFLAKNHFRPEHDYFDAYTIQHHWAPELLNGGFVSEKTSVYALGQTLLFRKENWDSTINDNKGLQSLIDSFVDPKHDNRPDFQDAYKRIDEIL